MGSLRVQGSPKEFDAVYRPVARIVQLVAGVLGTALLLCVGQWWWAPVPLAASFLIYEWFFWARADKPLQLELSDHALTIHDPFLDKRRTVSLATATTATLVYRRFGGAIDAVVVVTTDQATLFAIQFRLPEEDFQPQPGDVDADLCNAVLGSISGLIRALAPRDALVRQVVEDPAALDWLRTALPGAVWARFAVRFWRGSAPPLDLFGYHETPNDGMIVLDGATVRFSDAPDASPVQPKDPAIAERTAILFRMHGSEHEESSELLPLWLQPLGPRIVAIPAPLALGRGVLQPLDDALLHVHAPEGAVLLWALWRAIPPSEWPTAWREAIADARPHVVDWPTAIPLPV